MKRTYHDKHGKEILAGMTISHKNGETEKVYATVDANGNDDLGIMATNPAYAEKHPDCDIEYYPLSSFKMSEWEITNLPENVLAKEMNLQNAEFDRISPNEDVFFKVYPEHEDEITAILRINMDVEAMGFENIEAMLESDDFGYEFYATNEGELRFAAFEAGIDVSVPLTGREVNAVKQQINELSKEKDSCTAGSKQVMITPERIEELDNNWGEETNDAETQEWRADLTAEEAKLVAEWDKRYSQGVARMCGQILDAEAQAKKKSHKDRDER